MRPLQAVIDVLNVFHTLVVEPIFKRLGAVLGVDRNPVLPGSAATEHTIEGGPALYCQLQGLRENRIADTGGEIDEGLVSGCRRVLEMLQSFAAGISRFAFESFGALD